MQRPKLKASKTIVAARMEQKPGAKNASYVGTIIFAAFLYKGVEYWRTIGIQR